jgi:hypothetical protein
MMVEGEYFFRVDEMVMKEREVQHEARMVNKTIVLMYLYRNRMWLTVAPYCKFTKYVHGTQQMFVHSLV